MRLFFEKERRLIDKKQDVLNDLLGNLALFAKKSNVHPRVRFFEGLEGLRVVHDEVLKDKVDEIFNLVSIDDADSLEYEVSHDQVDEFREKIFKNNTAVHILYTKEKGKLNLPFKYTEKWNIKKISMKNNVFHGEITVFGDKVAVFSYRGNIFASIIESCEVAQTIRALFVLSWNSVK